jgi:N-acetylated-alpha-linked acidic dipeptidase
MIKEKLFDLSKDPTKEYNSPKAKEVVPFLNFSSLENALMRLKNATEEYQKAYSKSTQLSADKQDQLNQILYKAERSLIQSNGLPRRPWYRHQVYAPGYYTGYGVKTLPGIREAIEERHWQEAQDNIEIVAKTLNAYSGEVEQATAMLK